MNPYEEKWADKSVFRNYTITVLTDGSKTETGNFSAFSDSLMYTQFFRSKFMLLI